MIRHLEKAVRTTLLLVVYAIGVSLGVAATKVPANAQADCVGDCDVDGMVEINELVRGVRIALGLSLLTQCPSFDVNDNGSVEINELVRGVNNVLNGCSNIPSPTPTPTLSPGVPTNTPNLQEPARAIVGGSTVVVNVMNVVPAIVAAIANGFEFGSGSGAALGGSANGTGTGECPEGGSATRTGTFIPPNLMVTLTACKVATEDGFVTFDGTVRLNNLTFTVDITAQFEDIGGADTVTARGMFSGNVAGIPNLGGECEIRSLTLRLNTGSISTTKAGGESAEVQFTNTTVRIENILFLVPSCVPEAFRMTFNGPAALLAGDGTPVAVTFNSLIVDVDDRVEPTTFNISGGMTSPCFGGAATFETGPVLAVPDDEICPVAGTIDAIFAGGASRVTFHSDTSVDIDHNADGTVDETAPNCLDPRLLMCVG